MQKKDEEKFTKFTRRGRNERRSAERRKRNYLANSSTYVDARPTQKTSNPKAIFRKGSYLWYQRIKKKIIVSNSKQDKYD